ncbi:MAG: ATP-binding protein [Bacillati bacterium ANGP1]|uniref:ATP-binding protein n=1 Tax=Candidatus Segetimicrobium genomatis TaxID=2569760 RepID=A0A537KPV2_9BACT|nr:MAG: ATP-binding protein [Terrabacteria group bacterium ANGP1]
MIETRRGAEARLTKLERAVAGRPATDLDGLLAYLLNQILGESAPIDDAALLAVAASPLDPRRFHIELVALPDSLAALRNALRRWLPHIGATAEEIFAVTTAVGEAAANAIEHAYGPKEAAFEVEALVETGKLAIAVRDKGRWRPPRGPMRGHGLKMMRELMDSVEVASGPEGTMIRLSHTLRNAVQP